MAIDSVAGVSGDFPPWLDPKFIDYLGSVLRREQQNFDLAGEATLHYTIADSDPLKLELRGSFWKGDAGFGLLYFDADMKPGAAPSDLFFIAIRDYAGPGQYQGNDDRLLFFLMDYGNNKEILLSGLASQPTTQAQVTVSAAADGSLSATFSGTNFVSIGSMFQGPPTADMTFSTAKGTILQLP